MEITPNLGLTVWNLSTDSFSHEQLATNWETIDTAWGNGVSYVAIVSSLPGSPTAGQLVTLNTATGGFPAWTIVRYDGSAWRAVGPFEIQSAVPSSGNYAGRIVVLSSASDGFTAWSVILYNGTTWSVVGGFASVNTGSGALNIQGLSTGGDVEFTSGSRGPVLTDRSTGTLYRIYINNGLLTSEVVS